MSGSPNQNKPTESNDKSDNEARATATPGWNDPPPLAPPPSFVPTNPARSGLLRKRVAFPTETATSSTAASDPLLVEALDNFTAAIQSKQGAEKVLKHMEKFSEYWNSQYTSNALRQRILNVSKLINENNFNRALEDNELIAKEKNGIWFSLVIQNILSLFNVYKKAEIAEADSATASASTSYEQFLPIATEANSAAVSSSTEGGSFFANQNVQGTSDDPEVDSSADMPIDYTVSSSGSSKPL